MDIFNARLSRVKDLRFAACLDMGLDDGVSGIPLHSNKRWSYVVIICLQMEQMRSNDLNMLGVACLIRRLGVSIENNLGTLSGLGGVLRFGVDIRVVLALAWARGKTKVFSSTWAERDMLE